MASVYKRGNTWWVRFQWNGQEIRRSARTTSKAEAREHLDALKAQYRAITLGGRPRVPFRQAAAQYIEDTMPGLKPSSIASYQQSIRVLAAEFSEKHLDEISRKDIATFEAKQLRKKSASKVKHYRAALSGIFKLALRMDWVETNPCRDLEPIKIRNQRDRFLSPKEWDTLRNVLPEPIRSMAEMSVLRGLRIGEVISLSWSDIDWGQDLIFIRETKNSSPRTIPLEGARDVLNRQPGRRGLIFPAPDGRERRGDNLTKAINKAARDAGIPNFTCHDLRHTYASWYVQRGGDLYRLQKILGHKSPAMTQRYAHLRVDDLREDTQKWAQYTKDFLH